MSIEFAHVEDQSVEALVLFGSRSRGDPDMNSDTDIALFMHADSADELVQLRSKIAQIVPLNFRNMSVYSMRTAEAMAQHGSLFLWHLKLEGRILFKRSNWIDSLMTELREYSPLKAERDLRTFEHVLEDIGSSIKSTDITLEFELSTLYSVLRNLGMIVTALSGTPCFGRLEPILKTKALMGPDFRLTDREIRSLSRMRLMYSRNIPTNVQEIPHALPEDVWEKVQDVAEFVRRIINERIC